MRAHRGAAGQFPPVRGADRDHCRCVGIIASLTVFFAVHTIFDTVDDGRRYGWLQVDVPHWSTINLRALAVSALAFWLLFRRKASVLQTIGICSVVGGGPRLIGAAL